MYHETTITEYFGGLYCLESAIVNELNSFFSIWGIVKGIGTEIFFILQIYIVFRLIGCYRYAESPLATCASGLSSKNYNYN